MGKKVLLMDCTLRDGGYVNNWEFGHNGISGITKGLYEAGVDFIEVGILGKATNIGETTKYNNLEEIRPLMESCNADGHYAFMLNYSEKDNFVIPDRTEYMPDCLRLAFFRSEWKDCLEYARSLMNKGYKLFLQAMATPLYSDSELLELVDSINKLKPYSFYMVDSFGVLFNKDVTKMAKLIDDHLDSEISLGFHSHNNIQMAFSNSMSFIELDTERTLIIDSSVFGMGRGAGNLATELIASYMNEHYGKDYKIDILLDIYDDYLKGIFALYYWGYSMEYYATASKNTNSAYAWYLNNKRGVKTLRELNGVIDNLPESVRYSLFPKEADIALDKFRSDQDE